jgi:hypothetical protein
MSRLSSPTVPSHSRQVAGQVTMSSPRSFAWPPDWAAGPGAQQDGRDDGPEHPRTLAARGSLARCTGEAGDAAGARDHFAALLPVHERVLGPEHPVTRKTRGYLARWTGQAGAEGRRGTRRESAVA